MMARSVGVEPTTLSFGNSRSDPDELRSQDGTRGRIQTDGLLVRTKVVFH